MVLASEQIRRFASAERSWEITLSGVRRYPSTQQGCIKPRQSGQRTGARYHQGIVNPAFGQRKIRFIVAIGLKQAVTVTHRGFHAGRPLISKMGLSGRIRRGNVYF